MITTSEIKISVLVSGDDAQKALRAVHQAFRLHEEPAARGERKAVTARRVTDAAAIASRLQGINMEDLAIDDVALDSTQSRVTIIGVPDTPGVAAKVFEEVAAAGVFVDMIVQSYNGRQNGARLSFTVPQAKLPEAVQVANRLAQSFQCKGVTHSPKIAKLSVSGVGLRSHTGVAIRMFKALSEAGVNVEMINTSEVRVNVVVDGPDGERSLRQVELAFADVRP